MCRPADTLALSSACTRRLSGDRRLWQTTAGLRLRSADGASAQRRVSGPVTQRRCGRLITGAISPGNLFYSSTKSLFTTEDVKRSEEGVPQKVAKLTTAELAPIPSSSLSGRSDKHCENGGRQ